MMVALTALGLTTLSVGLVVMDTTTSAAAKSKAAKVVKTTAYSTKRKVHVQGGWMYTSPRLTRKNYHLTKFLYTKFYATKKVTVRKANGRTATLTYLKSKNGRVKGYTSTANVRRQWGYGKYSVKAYRKGALTVLNQERVKKGLRPLKASAKLNRIAQKNSNQMLKKKKNFKANLEGTPHAGWVFSDYLAPKSNPIIHYENGKQWGQGTVYAWLGFTDITINYGAKPYLYSKNHTHIGFGGTQHGQNIYMFVVLNHK